MKYSNNSTKNTTSTLALNCARNCLRYIVEAYNINEIYAPFYTCPVVWNALKKENCKIKFYHIDEKLYPAKSFPKEAYILYTNYSGICSDNVKSLAKEYKNLIIDNAQAYFMPKYGIASFNSVRKFIPAPDGAFLYIDKKFDMELETESASNDYDKYSFNNNTVLFDSDNIKTMSDITAEIIDNTDLKAIKEKRLFNFNMFHNELFKTNKLKINLTNEDVPMYYPYLTCNSSIEAELKRKNIPYEKFWNLQPKDTIEGNLQRYLLYLPIDQTQSKETILKIINIIQKHNIYV